MTELKKSNAVAALLTGAMAQMTQALGRPSIYSHNEASGDPYPWRINLDRVKEIRVTLDGKEVVITAAELFAALGVKTTLPYMERIAAAEALSFASDATIDQAILVVAALENADIYFVKMGERNE